VLREQQQWTTTGIIVGGANPARLQHFDPAINYSQHLALKADSAINLIDVV
jgi:hypothetical protein